MFENIDHPSRKSSHRLDEISHHFLSDDHKKLTEGHQVPFLPVLMRDSSQLEIIKSINNKLSLNGYCSHIVYIQEMSERMDLEMSERSFPEISLQDINWDNKTSVYNKFRGVINQKGDSDVYLIPVLDIQYRLFDLIGRIVILTDSTLRGISAAYAQIKELSPCALKTINIIMVSDEDVDIALRHYRKLADGVSRFLGKKIVNGGFVIKNVNARLPDGSDFIDVDDVLVQGIR
ncbi:MAG: hypothetical protein OEZ38_03780 [Gammaproteobacteria bacterium]|nr:hypothetical protein [Gammaproteobacteria bacterium]